MLFIKQINIINSEKFLHTHVIILIMTSKMYILQSV